MKWALPRLTDSDPVRHDPNFEPLAASLGTQYRMEFPQVERLVPASLGHIGLSYQPIIQYRSGDADFPRLQLGPGIFTVNQSGGDYEFEEFKALVSTHLATLRKVAQLNDERVIKPAQFGFALLNRFELSAWDAHHGAGGKRTKASEFLEEVLGVKVDTPYRELSGTRIFRQALSHTFDLEGDTGRLTLTARDASESPEAQIVTFDQVVTTPESAKRLTLDTDEVSAWLERAHGYTKRVFLNLRTQNKSLNQYLLTPRTPSP